MAGLYGFMPQDDDAAMATARLLMQMGQLGQQNAMPQRPSVSGSDVIGLSPEQTTSLLNRMEQSAQFEASLADRQNARQQAIIEGMNDRVFRARELEKDRRTRRRQQRQYEQGREERWRREQELGNLQRMPDGSLARVFMDPETGQLTQEPFADAPEPDPRYFQQGGQLGSVQDGAWVPVEGAPSVPVGSRGGASAAQAGGTAANMSPTQRVYAIAELRRQGFKDNQIREMMPGLLPEDPGSDSWFGWFGQQLETVPEIARGMFVETQKVKALNRLEERKAEAKRAEKAEAYRNRIIDQLTSDEVEPMAFEAAVEEANRRTAILYPGGSGGNGRPSAASNGPPTEDMQKLQGLGAQVDDNGVVTLPDDRRIAYIGGEWQELK